MAQMKLITGLLILLFSAACISILHAHQDDAVATVSKEKAVFDEETATGGTQQIGGRKISPVVKARKPDKKVKVTSAAVETTSFTSITSHKFAGNCEGEEMSNEKHCKKDVSHNFYEDVHDKGFVAFNADYHEPRHHPPKNN